MRIISGKFRGKVLIAPRNLPVRPTTDFAKEALFNMLTNHYELHLISVLDLFSGTGNISFECASRGVADITSVDASHHCVRYIKNTAEQLKITGLHALKADAIKFSTKAYRKWDLVFADPPYDFEDYLPLIDSVFSNEILEEEGMFILEHAKHTSFTEHPRFVESRKYGNVCFTFFE